MLQHLAVIMDGNGRWAARRGLPPGKGHEAGAESVKRILQYCQAAGIRYLTLYAFSVENWSRSKEEVNGLMSLLGHFMAAQETTLHENRVRLRVLGRPQDLPQDLQRELARIEAETAAYEHQLIVALSYGGRTEIATAARTIAEKVAAGQLQPAEVDEACVAAHLYLPDLPDPDLIIRTSGEMRLSNFLLWQASYAEFYTTPTLWPDFAQADFDAALAAFQQRKRRFGGRINEEAES